MKRSEKIYIINKKLSDKSWNLGCRFLIKWKPNETNDAIPYEIIYVQPRWSSTYTVIDGVVQKEWMHTSDYKNSEFCYKYYKWIYYIDFAKTSEEDFFNSIDTIGHPVKINNIEYHLNKDDYLEVRNKITKEELVYPIEFWNDEAIDLLLSKLSYYHYLYLCDNEKK